MGYSCSGKASCVLTALDELLVNDEGISNKLPNGGFYERGRENRDGAITGVVYKPYKPNPVLVVKAGSFRIEPTGIISRFPGVPKKIRIEAEKKGLANFDRIYRGLPYGVAIGFNQLSA